MVPPDESPGSAPQWPPPHTSPPLPPPREYGAPGTPLAWRPWLFGLLAVLVVGALVTVGLVVLLPGDSDDRNEGADAGRQPSPSPSTSPSASASSTPPAPPAPYRCWDGADAQRLNDCSRPTGVEGLQWLFPHLVDQKCGKPTKTGPGVVLRILCSARLSDGSRIQMGYYQWESVRTGAGYYNAQRLTGSTSDGFHRWTGGSKDTLKSAQLYAAAPFSLTVTMPANAQTSASDAEQLEPRPPKQVRGTPAG